MSQWPKTKPRRSHCRRGHPLTGDNVYRQPSGTSRCLTCKREQAKARRKQAEPHRAAKFPTGVVQTGVPGWGAG